MEPDAHTGRCKNIAKRRLLGPMAYGLEVCWAFFLTGWAL